MLICVGIKDDTFTWGWTIEWVASQRDSMGVMRSRREYRDVPVDEDAQILRFEDEE